MNIQGEPKRVLQAFISNDRGGLTGYICQNYRWIDKTKVQFDFLTYDKEIDFQNEFEKYGAKFFTIPRPMHLFSFIKAVSNIIKSNRYELIHFNLSYANIIPVLVAYACGVKTIIIHSHSTAIESQKSSICFLKNIIHKIGRKTLKHVCTDFLACSQKAGQWMYTSEILESGKFHIAKNAIDIEKYRFSPEKRASLRDKLGIGNDTFVIGHVGRFTFQKNHEFLIEIFKEIYQCNKNSKLILIGTGKNEVKIKRMVQMCGLDDKVLFLGYRGDIPELMSVMDCFVLPSLFEGLAIVGVEAQAAGLPTFFSTKISKELQLTTIAYDLSLNDGPKLWADRILQVNGKNRENCELKLIAEGYDIRTEIGEVLKFYLSK
jgi:glycosyltransferase involved in cell wall biosynthesis